VGKLLTLIMLILPTYLLTYLSSLVFWAQVMLHHATCEANSKACIVRSTKYHPWICV
jgi:hypothetical protein